MTQTAAATVEIHGPFKNVRFATVVVTRVSIDFTGRERGQDEKVK
jgi:hypothetical protein